MSLFKRQSNMKIFKFQSKLNFLALVLFLALMPGVINAKSMEFILIPPNQPIEVFGNAWQIFADGDLDLQSADKLKQLIKSNKIPDRSRIYLNSSGGSLAGGIELGKIIRENGLYTNVGKLDGIKEESKIKGITWKDSLISPANCLSACVLSYMGGEFRFLLNKSNLGVHRFYGGNSAMDSDITQIASSYVLKYINSMGVNESIFHEMVKVGRDDINILSKILASKLNLINEGYGNTVWSIESTTGGIYVKGERNTWRGVNKFLVVCDSTNKKIFQTFIFDTEGRDKDLVKMQSVSMFLNSKQIPIERYTWGKPLIINNTATVYTSLPQETLSALLKSESIGIAYQYAYNAPVFIGFDEMDLLSGKEKIENIIKLCKKN
jgi:hypothetical protein